MTIQDEINAAMKDPDSTSAERFLEILVKIKQELKSPLTSEYLQGKMDKIIEEPDEAKKRVMCRSLVPYLDWYLKGL